MTNFKRFLTLFFVAFLAVSAWATDAEYIFNAQDLSGTTLNGAANSSWSISTGTIAGYNATKGIQTTTATLTIASTDQYSNVTKVVLDYSTNSSSVALVSVTVGSSTSAEQQVEQSQTNATLTYNFSDMGNNKTVSVTMKRNGSSGSLYLKRVIVTYGSGGGGGTYTVTLSKNGSTSNIAGCSGTYTLPTTGEHVADACTEWAFHCWNNATYPKSTTAPSSTKITSMSSAGTAYAIYKHTEGGGSGSTETYTASSEHSNGDTSPSATVGDVTISYTQNGGATPPKYFSSGTSVRMYADNKLTITSSGDNITAISFTFGATTTAGLDANVGTYSAGSWTGNAASVEFEAGSSGQQHIQAISITLGSGGGTTYYSTDAECGPRVQATATPWVTSTNGQFVKVEVPVSATNFDKACTLSASVTGAGFSIVGWGANGNNVTKDVDLETTLILAYNPSAYNTTADATITFSSNYSGSQTPVYTAGTVHGRSLPEKFVIAIKNDDQWYALPANMSGSSTYARIAVDVDNLANPTKVTAGPYVALYSLLNVNKTGGAGDRYADYGTRVRFLGNEKCLWSNAANGGTGINNGAVPASATSDNYEWTLVTTDGVTYAINTNVAKKIEEGRELRYYAGESKFGMYAAGNSSFRFLPVDCDSRATVSAVTTTYNSVTLTWTGKSGTDYNVYIDESGVTKKTETNVSSPVTISGLNSETNYTWIISPGAKNADCALSAAFTTNVAPINVTLSCDGITHALGPQDKPYILPTTGEYIADACPEWEFFGWTNDAYSKSTSAPTLITQMNASGTAYAVYTHAESGGGSGSLEITHGPTTGSSYNTSYSTTEYTSESDAITISSNNILNGSSSIQLKGGTGNRIYNATPMPGNITQITVTATTGSAYVYVGSSSVSSGSTALEPTSGSINNVAVYTIPAGNTYFAVGATSSYVIISSIEVEYASNTSYYSTSSECCNEVTPPTVTVDAVDVSATISWDNQVGAVNGYNVTCSDGTNQDVAAGTTSLVISGLSPLTSYDYTVTAKGATCNRSADGSFTTANCSVIPTGVSITPGTGSAVVRWTHTNPTATVTVYSDEEATAVVKSEDNLSPGSTITGLEEGTTYYLRVFAGADCGSAITEFTTLSSAVIIAEWFPDSIRINLTADTATATVLIEDKQTTSTTATSYADGLFFSKYYEAYLSVKLWAIYNGTPDKISLENVKVKSANNGNYWGKDNTTGTGDDNLNKVTSLASYGHHETGYIYPGEEIIVYCPGPTSGTSKDPQIIACMESTYGTAYKDNPDSIWYLKNNLTTSLSGDDGLILLDGTDTLDIIGGKNTNAAYLATSTPSWGDEDGWNDENGTDEEGNIIGLSTNRCLLVRKNTVKNGLNAVAKNTNYFNTISEEWWGKHVPTTGDQIQTSCDNFSYVGHYDYNEYYAHFDSITTIDELGGKQNDDGTYTIPIPQLDTLSCTMMRIKVYEGTEEKASVEQKVPIMIKTADATTASDAYFHSYARETNSADVCKECDVVILKNAVLTKASSDDTKDIPEVRNLTIYPGGTLVVPSGPKYNFTVNSIQFRVQGENVPVAKLSGTLHTTNQQVVVSRRINNDDAYFFSLPYNCNIADITWSNGDAATLGDGFKIQEYDAATRANEGSTAGVPGHWKDITGSTIYTKKGYQIMVNSKKLRELIFPMNIGTTNVSDAENIKIDNTDEVTIVKNEGTATENNWNWNFIAEPYLCAMSPMEGDNIRAGWLKYNEGTTADPGYWTYEDGSNVYFTVYNPSSGTYDQKKYNTLSQLDPFVAYFVQGKTAGSFKFTQDHRILSAMPRRMPAEEELEKDASIFVGVTLSGNGQSDETSLRIRPDFTNEYQLGYDLQKFTTYYTERPQIYMKTPLYSLAFQAVSDSVAKNTWLPMGIYCYQPGTFTFALSENNPTDEVEAVYLYDATTGVTTNLLYDTYSITTTKQLYTNKRFSLNVILNRRSPQVTTDIGVSEAPDNMVRKILINGHVYIQRGNALYDVTGKQLLNR